MAGIVALVAAAGWFVSRSRQSSPGQEVAPPAAVMSTAPVPSPRETDVPKDVVGAAGPASEALPKKSTSNVMTAVDAGVATKKSDAKAEATGTAGSPPKAIEAFPELAALGFEPKALDRRQNARLSIDAERMPPGLDFTVEMNDKLYFQKTGAGVFAEDDGFFVPPGVHEFRVTAKGGGVEKTSNTVSTEFKANKRNSLKIELRVQGLPPEAGVPQDLYPNTQLVLTLK